MSPTTTTSSSKSGTAKSAPKTRAKRTPATTKAQANKPAAAPTTRTSARNGSGRAAGSAGTIGAVGSYAERAVLIPVGAALIARDRLVAGVNDLPRDTSTANARAQAQLRKFERRGTSARNSLEREARRTRVRLERELRKRRGELDRAGGQIERTVHARVKDAGSIAGKVQDRIPGPRRIRKAA